MYARRFILSLFAVASTLNLAIGQEILNHTKEHYSTEDGRLYWPADLPIYIFIASTPEASDSRRLKPEIAEHGDPLFLDTEGINWIRSNWAINNETMESVRPQVEVKYPVWRDGLAPITSIQFNTAERSTAADNPFYGPGLKVSATSEDGGSGVQATYVSVDGNAYQQYTDTLALEKNARHVLRVYSVDYVGNVEEPQEFVFDVDVTPPVTAHALDGEYTRNILSTRAQITLSSQDPASGISRIYYAIDSGQMRPYRSSIPFQTLPDGNHVLRYYSVDRVGNAEPVKEYPFYLDRNPPEVVATIIGDQYQNRGRVFISDRTTVELSADDNHSGVRSMVYSVDGGEEKDYIEPFPLKKSEGNHVVTFYAVDRVGNGFRGEFKEEYGGRQSLSLDMEAPKVSYAFGGSQFDSRDTTFITSKTEIRLTANDGDSGVKQIGYKINGGQGQVYGDPFTVDDEGFYMIDFFSTDFVNNRNTLDFFFVVDNTGPEIESIFSAEPIGTITLNDKPAPLQVFASGLTLYL
ncbi:MAG TPA: hypothetical protein DCP28_22860, partial [Cytophagales bacterium]|nr:hypothetical protein [Cytophagales bacterium]